MERTKESWHNLGVLERIISITGLTLSVLFAYTFYQNQRQEFLDQANIIIERSLSDLDKKLNIYETVLGQIQAHIITLNDIDEELFHAYYTNLSSLFDFKEFKGIGYSKYVPKEEVSSFLKEMHRIKPNYQIWPSTNEDKDFYLPLLFIEPRNYYKESLLGYDQAVESKRRKAFLLARQTGQTASSGLISTPQENIKHHKRFILIKSINSGTNFQNFNKRVDGLIFAQFTYDEFFDDAWSNFKDEMDFLVHEVTDDDSAVLIYRTTSRVPPQTIERKHEKFGKKFIINFIPKENLSGTFSQTILILIFGLALTYILLRIINQIKLRVIETAENKEILEETLRSRDEFISITSHELKNPLTSLKLKAQFLKKKSSRGTLTNYDISHFAEDIEKQVLRLELLVNDILDLSRMRTGHFSYSMSEFNFCELLEDIIIRMSEQFKDIPQQKPSMNVPCSEIRVKWDKFRMEQVITNLLSNAIKYGEKSPISINIKHDDKSVTISVSDKGRGIHPEAQETIFNRFERAGISANEISGLGLGLYITYQIVTYHQGKIWVESEVGKGSTFHVEIPKYPNVQILESIDDK